MGQGPLRYIALYIPLVKGIGVLNGCTPLTNKMGTKKCMKEGPLRYWIPCFGIGHAPWFRRYALFWGQRYGPKDGHT